MFTASGEFTGIPQVQHMLVTMIQSTSERGEKNSIISFRLAHRLNLESHCSITFDGLNNDRDVVGGKEERQRESLNYCQTRKANKLTEASTVGRNNREKNRLKMRIRFFFHRQFRSQDDK